MTFQSRKKLFRAYDPNTKKIIITGFEIYGEKTLEDLCHTHDFMHFDRLIITESTGAKIGGLAVYEFDILSGFSKEHPWYYVEYLEYGWWVVGKYGRWGTLSRFFEICKEFDHEPKIIGNLFENPELIIT